MEVTKEGRLKRIEAQRAWKRAQLALNERLGTKRVAALHSLIDECMGRLTVIEGEASARHTA